VGFLDLVVDGRPLRDLLNIPEDAARPEQQTTALRDDWPPKTVMEYLDRLLGLLPGDFDDGRIALLLCPVCGDVWCDTVSMELAQAPQAVTWRRFGWQAGTADDEPWMFPDQSFTFERAEYEQFLQGLRDRYGKRASWPPPLRGLLRLLGHHSSRK
jgi:hypothetical protein